MGEGADVLVLGVDGGGTKTLAALADRDGNVLALAAGRDTNPLDQPRWREHLAATVAEASRDAPGGAILAAAFGLPAYGEMAQRSAEMDEAMRAFAPRVTLRNDVHTAHEGAFAGGPGVLLLAGTGSMCWAADADGQTLRVGGWGSAFGDEGSAYWIGHEALARASQIVDGRLEGETFATAILSAVGTTWSDASDGMLTWFYRDANPRPAIASLAVHVDRLAGEGDAVAAAVMDEAADALALHVRAAWRLLGQKPGPWCFVGGVSRSAAVRGRLAGRLGSEPLPPLLPPVGGALWRAATEAGWRPDGAWVGRLSRQLSYRLS